MFLLQVTFFLFFICAISAKNIHITGKFTNQGKDSSDTRIKILNKNGISFVGFNNITYIKNI